MQVSTLIPVCGSLLTCEDAYMLDEKIIHRYFLLFAGRILDNSTKDLKFAFTNLTPFTTYDVYVAAETSAGIGPKSNISIFTPPEGKNISLSVLMRCFCSAWEFYCIG